MGLNEQEEHLKRKTDFGKVEVLLKLLKDTSVMLLLKGKMENSALDHNKNDPLILWSNDSSRFIKLITMEVHENFLRGV